MFLALVFLFHFFRILSLSFFVSFRFTTKKYVNDCCLLEEDEEHEGKSEQASTQCEITLVFDHLTHDPLPPVTLDMAGHNEKKRKNEKEGRKRRARFPPILFYNHQKNYVNQIN